MTMMGRIPIYHCSKCGVWIGMKRYSGSHALCRECNNLRSRAYSAAHYAKHGKRVRRKKLPGEPKLKSGPKREPITDTERRQAMEMGRSLPVYCGDLWSLVDQRRFGPMSFPQRGGNKRGNNGQGKHDVSEAHVQGEKWASHGESNPDPSNSPLLRGMLRVGELGEGSEGMPEPGLPDLSLPTGQGSWCKEGYDARTEESRGR